MAPQSTDPNVLSERHFYSEQQLITYRGFEITVHPEVFVPRQISLVQGVSPKNLRMYSGKSVLDMGTGTGVQSVIASASNAKSILAVDINPSACNNAVQNFQKYNRIPIEVRLSDLFENVSGQFDTMIAYLPSIDAKAHDMKDRAIFDQDFQTFRRFLKDAKEHLKPSGVIYTCWVNIDNSIRVFYENISKYGYEILESNCRTHENEEWWMFDLCR